MPTSPSSALRFVHGEPALLVGDALVIAELHIGYEQKLFPDTDMFFTDKLIARVKALAAQTGAKRLVINGDLKHSVKGVTPEEGRELAKFFEGIGAMGLECTVVKGNHDGGIENFLHGPQVQTVGQGGLRSGDAAICHGNAWPSAEVAKGAKTLVLAHSHPCVELDGKRLQCWLVGRLNERAEARFPRWRSLKVIVMPSFSPLVGCMAINKTGNKRDGSGRRLLGPLFKHEMFKLDEAQVYLLDGTCIGRAGNL
ncbi:Uncharacterised protein [Candidatus Burarchaeum australiense]|nr:Uncharacterised protein [Candidatus Burarchaeum australiense]